MFLSIIRFEIKQQMNQTEKDKFFVALINSFSYINKYSNGSQIFNKASYNKISISNSKIYNDILALKDLIPDLQFKFDDFHQDIVRLLTAFKDNFISTQDSFYDRVNITTIFNALNLFIKDESKLFGDFNSAEISLFKDIFNSMTSIFKDNGRHDLILTNQTTIEDRIHNLETKFNTQFEQILTSIKTINNSATNIPNSLPVSSVNSTTSTTHNNQPPPNTTSSNIDRNDNFWLDKIYFYFHKKTRYENHIKILKSHLSSKTTPACYFYKRFPTPFLPYNNSYVNEYNNLIKNTQIQIICLNLSYLEKDLEEFDKCIDSIKQDKLSNYNNLDTKLTEIKLQAESDLSQKLKTSYNKLNKIQNDSTTSLVYETKRHPHYYTDSFLEANTNTNISQNNLSNISNTNQVS